MTRIITIGAVALMGLAGAAQAQTEITFSYSDLSASYVTGPTMPTRVFSATSVAIPGGLNTGGDVSRNSPAPSSSADFPTGFAGISGAAISVSMNVDTTIVPSPNGPSLWAVGTFSLTDIDGDIISGTVDGYWTDLPGSFDSFQGVITSASITPLSGVGDLEFNGLGGTSFSYAGLQMSNLIGALVELQHTAGSFFNSDFSGVSSQVSGILVPAPGALALLGGAGLLALRRRR